MIPEGHIIREEDLPPQPPDPGFDPSLIRPVKDLMHRIISRHGQSLEDITGHPTCWETFNSGFGGLRPAELITVTADTGIGKSTFAMNLALDAARRGRPALLFSLENGIDYLATTLAQMVHKRQFYKFQKEDVAALDSVLETLPLYFYSHVGQLRDEIICRAIEYAAAQFGVVVVMIDHLDYVTKSRESWQSEAYVIGDCMRRFVGCTKRNRVTTLLLAHPSKLNQTGWQRREVGLDELKGSSSIKQESDAVFGLHRPQPDQNITQLRFLKIRNHQFGKNMGAKLRFKFDPESLWLEELSSGLEWGE